MIKRIFTLTEDDETGLSGQITSFDEKGARVTGEAVNVLKALSEMRAIAWDQEQARIQNLVRPGLGMLASQTDSEYVTSEIAKAEAVLNAEPVILVPIEVVSKEEALKTYPAEPPKGPLPDDFPCLSALHAADPPINTYGQLAKFADDYEQIADIGPQGAKKIREALHAPLVP